MEFIYQDFFLLFFHKSASSYVKCKNRYDDDEFESVLFIILSRYDSHLAAERFAMSELKLYTRRRMHASFTK
jgi:hypothetical protein